MSQFRTHFGFNSTALEVVAGVDLTGKRAIITGGSAGIGFETTRALAQAGADVIIGVRNPDTARSAVEKLRSSTGNDRIRIGRLDLSDLKSVTAFAAAYEGPLHILINNAGIMALPERQLTAGGAEMQFATNYLGHFALALGLRRALSAAAGARVVSVSSSGHLFSPVVFDDLNYDFIPYTPFGAYGQSKTACILLAVGISRRWGSDGVVSNALHPGAIATGLQKHSGGLKTPQDRRKSIEQGAATTVLLAASPLLDDVAGRYFEDCNEALIVDARPADFTGCARYALDADNADRLWERSLRLLEVS